MNSYQLKYIALITMIIDHIGIVFNPYLPSTVYMVLRGIGRMAFPIYAFLLVEGFYYTRNQEKYLMHLLIFSLLSEIPFDLSLNQTYGIGIESILEWTHQNVFITLALGLAAMMMLARYEYSSLMTITIILVFTYAGEYIKNDYGSIGILTIILFYYVKRRNLDCFKPWSYLIILLPLIGASMDTPIQIACLVAAFLITLYNGEKGRGSKYLFYIAYPAHLLILLIAKNIFEAM